MTGGHDGGPQKASEGFASSHHVYARLFGSAFSW